MKWDRKFWRRYAAFAGVLAGAEAGICVPQHAWPQLGITLGATATTMFYSRRGFKTAARREAHRPDYAKIARLEIELGLVDPPKPPPPSNPSSTFQLATNLYAPKPSPQTQSLRMPDHRCSLCIPGRPATNCPFNSICQTHR